MRRVAVTGIGAVTGFGFGVEPLFAGLLEGRRAMRMHAGLPRVEIVEGAVGPLSLVPLVPFDLPARAIELAMHAADEAVMDAGGVAPGPRLGVTFGSTLGGIGQWLFALRNGGLPASSFNYGGPAQAVAAKYCAEGPLSISSVACASGNAALGAALDLLTDGRCDAVLAGGADALHDFVIHGFSSLKALDLEPCRPFDRSRRGLNLGEGAAFVVLENEAHARQRGARIRAYLDGFGASADAVHMTGPDREGRGAARAITAALADASLPTVEVDFISAHGTATNFNDLMEAKALRLVFGDRVNAIPTNSIKSAIGHTLGAAGALEAVMCVRALETGVLPPTPGLEELDPEIALRVVRGSALEAKPRAVVSTSSGFGGVNAAIVLRAV
jgi:3-oxoacyl-[acyl-carrier-protein] synthase II